MKLFGSSGIRGLANVEITTELSQKLGAALSTMFEGGEIVVGRDARVTGQMLEAALASSITSHGLDVKLIGVLPTPVIAWLVKEMHANAGVAISASHNPPQYNGLKVFNGRGMSFTEEEQRRAEELIESPVKEPVSWDCVGTIEEIDAHWMYIDTLSDNLELENDWNIACDLFCGATTTIASDVFKSVGVRAQIINGNTDGHFPAGEPEPTIENLKRLGAYMRNIGAEVGFGFDGDGDRMMAVDENGTPVSGDRLLAAYAGYIVEKLGGGTVVTHVGTSMCIDDTVYAAGGKVLRTPVGDAFITEHMEKHNAIFGGEPIGAWVIPKINMCPDGILSACKLLEALEEKEMTLSEFAAQAPEYPTINSKVGVKKKYEVIDQAAEHYRKFFQGVKSVNRVDGIRLQLEEGWILIRASGTEPLVRFTAEGRDLAAATEMIEKGKDLIKKMEAKV